MKLIGSDIEAKYRSELIDSNHLLFSGRGNRRLLASINRAFSDMESAFVLDWVPEQGEDIFTVLVNDNKIAVFELARSSNELADACDVRTVEAYRRGLRKHRAIKLAVALDLLSNGYSRPGDLSQNA